jgi:glycosyltransferase involved in cell wall biosynthesis
MSVFVESQQYSHILHPQFFDAMLRGADMRGLLEDSARTSAADVAAINARHPNVSIVIRTRNDRSHVEGLFEDINRQIFQGEIQVVLADTESNDGTADAAKAIGRNLGLGVTIVPIAQQGFSYPVGLNQAFQSADHSYILSLVGHESLSNTQTLDAAIRGARSESFGGAYGLALPNVNSTRSEQLGSLVLGIPKALKESELITTVEVGALASDRAVISRDVWRELGGYNVAYGAGGEDGDLARRMHAAGFSIIRDPILTTHHTHGLGPIRSLVQLIDWYRISRPHKFNPTLHRFIRPEQRLDREDQKILRQQRPVDALLVM